jgi:hypothetical protein
MWLLTNPSLVPFVFGLTSCSYLWNCLRASDDVSHTENLQSNCCQWISHLYKLLDRIQVTRVFRYFDECQG